LFLSPHNLGDDETLFGAFTILRHQPHVVICFKSQVQEDRGGPTAATREKETQSALWWLGLGDWLQSPILDTNSDEDATRKLWTLFAELDSVHQPERVWAPYVENGGHNQHNLVGSVAIGTFGVRYRPYLTYRRGSMRTRGTEIPFQPNWIAKKMRALSCYESQIELDNTRPWFTDDTLREYVP
jgi:LmbE family N-acetylglucosaminyl deacetylase